MLVVYYHIINMVCNTLSIWWDFTLCLITKFIYIANIIQLVNQSIKFLFLCHLHTQPAIIGL